MVEPPPDSEAGRRDATGESLRLGEEESEIQFGIELRSQPKIIRFADLSRCGDEIWIELEGQLYRLRKTRQGKLILTK